MAYSPKTQAGRELETLITNCNATELLWLAYAARLGSAYTRAYEKHQDALTESYEQYRLAAESAYWVLSLFCVAFAGGMVGGLMAPWVTNAGKGLLAGLFSATTASETAQSLAQGITQKLLPSANVSGSPFKPQAKSPLLYYQDMVGEIGLCYASLKRHIWGWMEAADKGEAFWPPDGVLAWRTYTATELVTKIMGFPIIKHAPTDEQMPDLEKARREIEIGMWIAWAHVRKVDYWKKRMDRVSGRDAFARAGALAELSHLQAVVDRLIDLKIDGFGTRKVKHYDKPVLDIIRLQSAGPFLADMPAATKFVGKVGEVIKDPMGVLPALSALPPAHAR